MAASRNASSAAFCLALLAVLGASGMASAADDVPVIYISDLYHPAQDPDDHYDMAAMFALQGISLELVVIDGGPSAGDGDGRSNGVPIDQLNYLTGRHVPYRRGLDSNMTAPDDQMITNAREAGVLAILEALSRLPDSSVVIVSIGSCRDLAVAFNRDPDLLLDKVDRAYVFAGNGWEASTPVEWNVALDPVSYCTVMRSGLPIYWVPCFCGAATVSATDPWNLSWWTGDIGQMLADATDPLWQYFLYMNAAPAPAVSDPIAWLDDAVDSTDATAYGSGTKWMWCAALFAEIAGCTIVYDSVLDRHRAIPAGETIPASCTPEAVWRWEPVEVDVGVGVDGVMLYQNSATSQTVTRFGQLDHDSFDQQMTDLTRDILARASSWTAGTGGNLARAATASASSTFNATFEAAFVNDGTCGTRWNSGTGLIVGEWVALDFGVATEFDRIVLKEWSFPRIDGYRIELRDGAEWTPLLSGTTIGEHLEHAFAPVSARELRLVVLSTTSDLPTINEIEVYSSPPADQTPSDGNSSSDCSSSGCAASGAASPGAAAWMVLAIVSIAAARESGLLGLGR